MSNSYSDNGSLPIRLAGPNAEGVPFRDWLARRTRGDRRTTERLLAFIQSWDHLRDESQDAPSPAAYAARWRVSPATAYRLVDEFRTVFPSEADPGRLLDMLWDGLSERYVGHIRLGSLVDVRVVRNPVPGPRDLRDILPPITIALLEAPIYDASGVEVPVRTRYEAYETKADRFAWAVKPSGESAPPGAFISFILEGDAEDLWLPALGSTREHSSWDDAEIASAASWAMAEGLRLQRISVRVPSPVFRLAPGARPSSRDSGF
jgi:hypothetical protein